MQAAIASLRHAPDEHRQKRRAGKRPAFVTIIDPGVSIVQWIGIPQAKWAIAAGH
jgi:hypothetical protein